jgi:hypothetical protein
LSDAKTPHEISVPSWLVVAAVLGMGPADTLASHLVTGPGYTELSAQVSGIQTELARLSMEVQTLKQRCQNE